MKLIELKQAERTALINLKKRIFTEMQFYTFKKDRSVILKFSYPQTTLLVENGYTNQKINLELQNAKKELKNAFKREFPRSHKVYYNYLKK